MLLIKKVLFKIVNQEGLELNLMSDTIINCSGVMCRMDAIRQWRKLYVSKY